MSTQANLIGFGNYKSTLNHCFHYPYNWYVDMIDGDPVIVKMFFCETRDSSESLMRCFGLEGFKDQKIINTKINWPKLQDFVNEYKHEPMDIIKFQAFIDHGFQFYFDLDA